MASVNRDHVGHAGLDAKRLENLRLDDAAPSAERHVESEESLHSPPSDVLEDGGLNCLFGAAALAAMFGAAHDADRKLRRAAT